MKNLEVYKESVVNEFFKARAKQFNVGWIYEDLLRKYPQFLEWSGSHNNMLHHYGLGGLAQHTREVIEVGLTLIPTLNLCDKIDPIEYFLAALFHDTGKMFDYEPVYVDSKKEWKPTEHKRLIHHISRSALIWHDLVEMVPYTSAQYHDKVLHAILAHHGAREAGSPVAPKTRVAWLLHLSDGISARMNDCDRLDVVNRPKYP